ncbi:MULTISPECIES: YfgM family protein [unclassified Gilliamella]|uniref:YfgM family protein n=1 Tax=unclassified Gilliamella TaxID=2685620 RepID=UPI00226A9BBD|nr:MULTISPECIES: tetratricopeptide repeat protein [unclassified Gilliamella]MCX8574202.1 tetratricopeptide repeat protein [Gilliamella sp. B3831]MCX8576433.1 tetratricopeptide repeat protein [Gilliamella sp. B3815]MCX8590934.1 tetratricopeptide repeat protein [Gilliamella sp. B3812]MCX8603680.1 tetratricopeptide repeat protein [Gilliamella sp. B3823]MCX8606072.1 tetratricopeptide repeat protein [Gilliamella sp. B3825]
MSYQSSSEEQMWALKEFLAKTWKIIVAVIVIGLLAYYGWNYYQSNQVKKLEQMSDRYEQLVKQLDQTKPESVNDLVAFAKEGDSVYNVFADLFAAKFYIEVTKDYAGAQALLTDALSKTKAEPVKSVINIRIARVQYQQNQYQESLATLDKVNNEAWEPVINEIRGDILTKMSRYAEAIDAYKIALKSAAMISSEPNIKIKLNQAEYLQAKQTVEQDKQTAEEKAEQEDQSKTETEENKN